MDERDDERPRAKELLRELGFRPRLTVYLAAAPGAGKTRRLLEEARALQASKVRVALAWIETKHRSDLDELARDLPRIEPRAVPIGSTTFPEFDYAATVAARPTVVVLDELAHTNLPGGAHEKRWQDALALRDEAGISVLGAFNIQHLETIAPIVEQLIGFPVREIIPLSFLQAADQVIAVDVSPDVLDARLRDGRIVHPDDVARALQSTFRPQTLRVLRELVWRTVDDLTVPELSPRNASSALAVLTPGSDPVPFLRAAAAIAEALDLALDVAPAAGTDPHDLRELTRELRASLVKLPNLWAKGGMRDVQATLILVPNGRIAQRILDQAPDRDVLVVDPAELTNERTLEIAPHALAQTAGDRLKIGYGHLTVFLGAAAGSGKTYAMLDRAHQLASDKVDVVAALIETHGRLETARLLDGLELLPRKKVEIEGIHFEDLDLEALLKRRPQVALIDELAHTNAPNNPLGKRYQEVLEVIRAGISVMTTMNVQHVEGLGDAVARLTGLRVRETVPESVLAIADELILIDTPGEIIRDRLRSGRIYPQERIEAALSNFFRPEKLTALRELALRESIHTHGRTRKVVPFSRIVALIEHVESAAALIERCARLATRLGSDLTVAYLAKNQTPSTSGVIGDLRETTRALRGRWIEIDARHLGQALNILTNDEPQTVIAIEGSGKASGIFRPSPGLHLLRQGVSHAWILAPSERKRVPD
ncbi:MAG TPA: hypothetical protein VGZ00_08265 [Candidatus Baltobacteraceae bacterium]|jgi:two-component system sensor histidine kinase KdpD|nr:hypothetical protein [Candidatus Baltobacteraceae bacterium]